MIAVLKIIGSLVQQPHPVVMLQVTSSMSEAHNQFQYVMTNFRPN